MTYDSIMETVALNNIEYLDGMIENAKDEDERRELRERREQYRQFAAEQKAAGLKQAIAADRMEQ